MPAPATLSPIDMRFNPPQDPEDSPAPNIHIRWFQVEVQDLLSIAPIVLNHSTGSTTWRPLTRKESIACEEAWRALPSHTPPPMSRTDSTSTTVPAVKADVDEIGSGQRARGLSLTEPLTSEVEEEEDFLGIPIEREKLFEVDVRSMTLRPVYWRTSGPTIKVMRAIWMFDEHKPLESELGAKIEAAYMSVKPWLLSYAQEMDTAKIFGVEAQAKLAFPLADTGYLIIFEDDGKAARLITSNPASQRFSSMFSFGATRQSPYDAGSPGVVVIYRGYDEVRRRMRAAANGLMGTKATAVPNSVTSSPITPVPPTLRTNSQQRGKLPKVKEASYDEIEEEDEEDDELPLPTGDGIHAPGPDLSSSTASWMPPDPNTPFSPPGQKGQKGSRTSYFNMTSSVASLNADADDGGEITDLILLVHGIGQGLAAQYETWDFVYATNLFRNVCRKQAQSPALASIMRNRRVQFLPVQWRASMKFDLDAEAQSQGHENHYTLRDVTPKGSIAYVRELTNSVLTDIPLFMSHHRGRMIESVCEQANRAYRLWCARNPKFEKHGRVHVIAHSLGSALIAHILSNQPTIVPPLSTLSADPDEKKRMDRNGFIFNTHKVFNAGSPLAVFLRIQESSLISRKGRERTMNSPTDEAIDRVGLFGCLAVDSLYNIFYSTDPIAYLLNPTVDSKSAREMQPTAIPNVTAPVLAPLRTGFGRFMQSFAFGSSSSSPPGSIKYKGKNRPRLSSAGAHLNPSPPPLNRGGTLEGLEMFDSGKTANTLEGTRAERRFLALNPHGTLDFYLPGEGGISEYLDMLYAHSAYWNDPSFASFIQTEIFASKTDMVRTSVGTGSL
ncbi:hypothetical protein DL93DRAFT_1212391 [Clavulina sp. PMI_390]|nr:hypothetical protein DL93DRAFT_1212391 [Clavulina sp. PMI_390]